MRGFTLIEVILAIFILVAGIVGVLGMFSLGVQTESKAKMSMISLELVQAKLEELVSLPYSEINSLTEDYGQISGFESYKRQADIAYWDPANSTTSQTDLGIKRIKVIVFWDSNKQNSELLTLIQQQ